MSISIATRHLTHFTLPPYLSHTLTHQYPNLPIASTSKIPFFRYSSSSSSSSSTTFPTPTRKIYASAQSQPGVTGGGFDIPPPVFEGRIEVLDAGGKGKAKASDLGLGLGLGLEHAVKQEPKRKVAIKSKKAAITMTPAAITRLRDLISSPTEPLLLRIGVKTRGCAGMAYHLDYVPPPGGRFDEIVEQDGVKVLIDSKALFSIIGSRMDWRDNRLSAGFVFDNPNVVDTCGCGESFNIQV